MYQVIVQFADAGWRKSMAMIMVFAVFQLLIAYNTKRQFNMVMEADPLLGYLGRW